MKTHMHPTVPKGEVRGVHVAAFFIAFFGIIFTVNFTMAALANGSWTGLIAKNGYVASKDLAIVHRKRRLALGAGWSMTIDVQDGNVSVTTDGLSADVPADLTVVAERPLNEKQDIRIEMMRAGTGLWRSSETLPNGRWTLVATLTQGPLALTERLSIAPEGRGADLR